LSTACTFQKLHSLKNRCNVSVTAAVYSCLSYTAWKTG
jgi:hypothetical protein